MNEQTVTRDERAGEEAADPNRLLPDEDPSSHDPDDARHWLEVYDELLDFKRKMLTIAEEALEGMRDKPARREVVDTDRRVLRAECDRFEKRLAFWRNRLAAARDGKGP
ncbi:MAG: hypothetical protein M3Y62_01915 [Candidatus Dormibacteraeota bacterium]|uniref:hypothetical protein n=1 Tax=Candidatus Dormibacter sp. TaxID=2973982 RepID=UPI000DB54113|nr:hypothetical protein [Candidatus Dormibacteraeota bacterium]PZR65535.1 MAG: hypothetical protein DLM66_15450 [Candidatus Dormibacteraeota bacterium]